jgi:homoserine/homoserine lactone efflux protein
MSGILAANALWFAASAGGLGALLASGGPAFSVVRLCGAAYLVVLGARQLFAPRKDTPHAGWVPSDSGSGSSYGRGFLVQGTNPSLLVYFGSILPQFVEPAGDVPLQIGILALSSFAIEAGVLGAYAALAGRARRVSGSARFQTIVARTGGALLIIVGAGLATLRTF